MCSAPGQRQASRPRRNKATSGRCWALGRAIIRALSSRRRTSWTYFTRFRSCSISDKYQCPGLVLSDLLISEGTASIDPDDLDFHVKIDRGELILPNGNGTGENPASG